MREALKRYCSALDDTAPLVLYAACWLLALFTQSPDEIVIATFGRVLSALAATMAVLFWINRPALRPGWRLRDALVLLPAAVAAFEVCGATIRPAAMFGVLELLELMAVLVTAVYLSHKRPQPFFLVNILLLAGAAVLAWRRHDGILPQQDPAALGALAALTLLALLPWLAIRWFRGRHRWYHWVVLGAAVALVVCQATNGFGGVAGWARVLAGELPSQTRQVVSSVLRSSWLTGCGPHHYEWIFRARMPEDYTVELGLIPGALMLLLESGVIGLGAMLAFGVAMLWRFRPGDWAPAHPEVMGLARGLRWAAACAFFLYLATPALRSLFGQVVLWSLLGMMRSWSSRTAPAAVALATGQPEAAVEGEVGLEPPRRLGQSFLTFAALLGGILLVLFQLRPLVAAYYRHVPRKLALHDVAVLDRLELARLWWPDDPRNENLEAMHYRAKAGAGKPLLSTEIATVTKAYERMIEENPYDPAGFAKLADWWAVRGELPRAIEVTRQGLSRCPASFELQYSLGSWYRRMNESTRALAAYEAARLLRPHSLPVLRNLAELELQQGDLAQARQYVLLALQLSARDPGLNALLEAINSGKTIKAPEPPKKAAEPPPPAAPKREELLPVPMGRTR